MSWFDLVVALRAGASDAVELTVLGTGGGGHCNLLAVVVLHDVAGGADTALSVPVGVEGTAGNLLAAAHHVLVAL